MSEAIAELHTPRLLLRGFRLQDAVRYQQQFADYEVVRNLSAEVPWPYPEDGVFTYLRDVVLPRQGRDYWAWGMFLREAQDACIGGIDLWRVGRPEHRGFWLGRAHWGRGLMTEAAAAVNEYAFTALDFEVLVFSNARGNVRSRRIKEKTGARFVGTQPAAFVDPQFTENELWELTRDAWRAWHAQQPAVRSGPA